MQQQPRDRPNAAAPPEAAASGCGCGRHLPPKRRLEGLGLLLLAALVGGTYAPTLRLAYSLPQPPSPAVMAASRGCLELLLLSLLLALLAVARHRQAGLPRRPSLPGSGGTAAGDEAQQPLLQARQGHALQQAVVEVEEGEGAAEAAQVQRPLPLCLPAAVLGALEIGWVPCLPGFHYRRPGRRGLSSELPPLAPTRCPAALPAIPLLQVVHHRRQPRPHGWIELDHRHARSLPHSGHSCLHPAAGRPGRRCAKQVRGRGPAGARPQQALLGACPPACPLTLLRRAASLQDHPAGQRAGPGRDARDCV